MPDVEVGRGSLDFTFEEKYLDDERTAWDIIDFVVRLCLIQLLGAFRSQRVHDAHGHHLIVLCISGLRVDVGFSCSPDICQGYHPALLDQISVDIITILDCEQYGPTKLA